MPFLNSRSEIYFLGFGREFVHFIRFFFLIVFEESASGFPGISCQFLSDFFFFGFTPLLFYVYCLLLFLSFFICPLYPFQCQVLESSCSAPFPNPCLRVGPTSPPCIFFYSVLQVHLFCETFPAILPKYQKCLNLPPTFSSAFLTLFLSLALNCFWIQYTYSKFTLFSVSPTSL